MATSTFKKYYEDPEFKKKHLEKMSEKIKCDCGFMTARCNLSRHKKSHIHIKKMEKAGKLKNMEKIKQLKEELKKLKEELKK